MDQRLLLGIVSSKNSQELTLQLDYLIHLNAKNMNCQCLQGNSNFSLRAQNVQNVEQHDKMDRGPRADSRINTQQNSQHLEQLHFNH